MPDEDKSKIDRLKDALYSRKVKIKPSFVLDLHGHGNATPDKWEEPIQTAAVPEKPKGNYTKKIFWGAIAFFIICTLVAGYVYISGRNLISSNNIKVDVLGPSSIKAGDITTLDVSVTNKNDTPLEIADLIVSFPEGTRNADDGVSPLPRTRVALGTILPGETVRQSVKMILYGEEGKNINIGMTIEYRLPNSSSVFEKQVAYEGIVGTAPLTITVDALKEVNSQQDYTLKVKVTSNSVNVVQSILLAGSLPKGFDIVSIDPEPFVKGSPGGAETLWNLGDIEPRGTRTMTIRGKMYGDKNEKRYFKFDAGVQGVSNKATLGARIASVTHTVDIRQAFIGVSLLFNRSDEADNYVAESGTEISSIIRWQNNLSVPIYDVTIDATVDGDIVDHDSIEASSGFYDSNKGVVRWNGSYDKNLQSIAPGQTGGVDMAFNLFRPSEVKGLSSNPEFTINITVHGKRRLETGVPEDIISTVQKTIKVSSATHLTAQIVHTTGPIENEGDIPPKVGKKTTYTVIWAITNSFNKLSDAKVVATLPDYITWENIATPALENISYNPNSREVTWRPGNVDGGTGSAPVVRQVAFQIGLVPSVSQVGAAPVTVNIANFTGNDTFTGLSIQNTTKALTTELGTDPSYHFGDGIVVE